MRIVVLLLLLSFICIDTADARGGRRRGRRVSVSVLSHVSFAGGPQEVALAKAQYIARRGFYGHPGGGYAGCAAEGVGFSTYSAKAALASCCFTGVRPLVASAVVRGVGGWYGVKLFR